MSTSQRFGDTWASVILDLMRGLAAVIVLGDHWRNFFFVDFPEVNLPRRKMFVLPYVLTAAGHQAAVIFFVLSGFFISGSVIRMLQSNSWTWRRYATHRLDQTLDRRGAGSTALRRVGWFGGVTPFNPRTVLR